MAGGGKGTAEAEGENGRRRCGAGFSSHTKGRSCDAAAKTTKGTPTYNNCRFTIASEFVAGGLLNVIVRGLGPHIHRPSWIIL